MSLVSLLTISPHSSANMSPCGLNLVAFESLELLPLQEQVLWFGPTTPGAVNKRKDYYQKMFSPIAFASLHAQGKQAVLNELFNVSKQLGVEQARRSFFPTPLRAAAIASVRSAIRHIQAGQWQMAVPEIDDVIATLKKRGQSSTITNVSYKAASKPRERWIDWPADNYPMLPSELENAVLAVFLRIFAIEDAQLNDVSKWIRTSIRQGEEEGQQALTRQEDLTLKLALKIQRALSGDTRKQTVLMDLEDFAKAL